jgi:hypothetical protein
MRRIGIIAGLAALGLALSIGWQIGAAVVADIELHDDLQDVASQLSLHVGLDAPITDDQFRAAVVNKAKRYDIDLQPGQVTVQRTGYGLRDTIYLQANYSVPINLLGHGFELRFTPESGKRLSE